MTRVTMTAAVASGPHLEWEVPLSFFAEEVARVRGVEEEVIRQRALDGIAENRHHAHIAPFACRRVRPRTTARGVR